MIRIQLRCRTSGTHIGYLFLDGPEPAELSYCIKSSALRFVPQEDLRAEGSGEFTRLFTSEALAEHGVQNYKQENERMKTNSDKTALSFAAATVAAVSLSSAVQASGHFVSGLQDQYPAYDLNDTYVFQSSNDGFTSFISSANPSLPGTNTSPADVIFGDEGLYSLHIAQDGGLQSGMTLVFSFDGKNVEVSKAGAPNAAAGEAGAPLGSGKVGDTLELPDGIRVWTGLGEEPGAENASRRDTMFTPSPNKSPSRATTSPICTAMR